MVTKKADVYVLLGTRKGAFMLHSDSRRRNWKMKGPFFENSPVFHMAFDKRDGKTIYAAVNSGHFGPTVFRSKNFGRTWENSKSPHASPKPQASRLNIFGILSQVTQTSLKLSMLALRPRRSSEAKTEARAGRLTRT